MTEESFEVRVSRRILFLLTFVGLLFLLTGLDLAVLHVFFDPVAASRPVLRLLFSVLAMVMGALIVVTQGAYIVSPPTMMKITMEGVSFGTGARYKPYLIPLAHLKSVSILETESMAEVMGRRKTVEGGVTFDFEASEGIPAGLATSAGISYQNYCLTLNKIYADRTPLEIVEAVRRYIGRN